jgi:hypothetical protein
MMTSPDKTGDGRKARFLEPSPFDGDRGEKIGIERYPSILADILRR